MTARSAPVHAEQSTRTHQSVGRSRRAARLSQVESKRNRTEQNGRADGGDAQGTLTRRSHRRGRARVVRLRRFLVLAEKEKVGQKVEVHREKEGSGGKGSIGGRGRERGCRGGCRRRVGGVTDGRVI